MHLHFLVTEGGTDEAGVFHKIPRIDDSRLAEIFAREVLAFLVGRELLSPEWAERILSWPHSGFNVHGLVRAKTKPEAVAAGFLAPIGLGGKFNAGRGNSARSEKANSILPCASFRLTRPQSG
jgi:hypothetical protein